MKNSMTRFVVGLCLIPAALSAEPLPQSAPVNPEFVAFVALPAATAAIDTLSAADAARRTGQRPSPLDFSHLKGKGSLIVMPYRIERGVYPATYDLRSSGKVSPVRDQGSCGACWAFSPLASLESTLLTGESWDFSENNLKNTSGFDWGHCDGGNDDMAMAYLGRWGGPVSEADDPYSVSSGVSPGGLATRKHVQEVLNIPDRGDAADNDAIKQALTLYGVVKTSMYMSEASSYYSPANSSYYYNGSSGTNHGVAIVGWDDNYSAANFATTPPGNGAFIIKNSWGTSWGDAGYFHVSYYDSKIGSNNHVYTAGALTNYASIYQYDPLGQTSASGYSSTTGWFANIFTAQNYENIEAVSFFTMDINAAYEVYLYKGVSSGAPRSGILASQLSGTIPYPGYHTLPLNIPVAVTAGERFSVVVKVTNPAYIYPIPLEAPISSYSSQASAIAGQSFMSSNGTSWSDVTTATSANTNACVKAFASPNSVTGVCGPANGGTFTAAPDTDLCSSGTASAVTGSGPWQWSCYGSGSGTDASCSAEILSYPLTVALAGTGSGTVNSIPAGFICPDLAGGSPCSKTYPHNTALTLVATPDAGSSTFSGWTTTPACVGTGNCAVIMDSAKNVTATFTLAPLVTVLERPGVEFGTISDAYNDINTVAGSTIRARVNTLPFGELFLNRVIAITIKGGFDPSFSAENTGYSSMGTLTVATGSLTVERIIIR